MRFEGMDNLTYFSNVSSKIVRIHCVRQQGWVNGIVIICDYNTGFSNERIVKECTGWLLT